MVYHARKVLVFTKDQRPYFRYFRGRLILAQRGYCCIGRYWFTHEIYELPNKSLLLYCFHGEKQRKAHIKVFPSIVDVLSFCFTTLSFDFLTAHCDELKRRLSNQLIKSFLDGK